MTAGAGVWTEEAVAAAKKYNDAGLSRSQIAAKIFEEAGQRFTRNAVIGKLARLGVACANKSPGNDFKTRVLRPKRKPVNVIHLIDAKAARVAADQREAVLPKVDALDPAAMQERVKLVAARNPVDAGDTVAVPFADRTGCAFIVSADGAPTMACNMKIASGCYCAGHSRFTHAGFGAAPRRRA